MDSSTMGSTTWCWSDDANEPVIAIILSEGHGPVDECFDVLVEGRRAVKSVADLYDTKEKCEHAHWVRRRRIPRVKVEVAKSLFPVQPMPDGAIPYYLDEKEKTDEEV